MKPLYRNLFFLFGICAIGVLIWQFPEGWDLIRRNRSAVLLYLPGVVGVWAAVYACNARAFQLMVNTSDHDLHLPYRHAFKLTLSGYAFSYTTPFGSGGSPYRVLELSRFIGMPRAVSSVALYALLHVFSHFFLWTTALLVFVGLYSHHMTPLLWSLTGVYLAVFCGAILFFRHSSRHGIIARLFRLLFYVPLLRRPARRFYDRHADAFRTTDANIRFLADHPRSLWGSLLLEYVGRLLNAFEFYFILLAFGIGEVHFSHALILLGFSSLMGNLLFFLPMQIGAREGSLALIMPLLFSGVSTALGIYVAFFTRIREIFWIVVGISLVKTGNRHLMR